MKKCTFVINIAWMDMYVRMRGLLREQSGPNHSGSWTWPLPIPTGQEESHKHANILRASQATDGALFGAYYQKEIRKGKRDK